MKLLALALIVVLLLQTLPMIVGTFSLRSFQQEAEAQAADPAVEQLIERGRDSATYDLGNGQRKTVLGLDPWVFDESQGKYSPHTVASMPDGTLQVRSGMIGWKIGPDSAVITDSSGKNEQAREVWRVYVGEDELEKQFVLQSVNNYDNVVQVINRYDTVIDGSRAVLTISYAIHAGKPTERIAQILGISDELKSQVRIEREWLDIDTDELLYSTSESQSLSAVSPDSKTLAVDSTGEYVRLMKGDKLVLHENLKTAGDKLQSVDYEQNLVKFTYSGWDAGTTVKLTDDTYSTSSGTFNHVQTSSATGSDCPSPSTTGTNPSPVVTSLGASGSSTFCRLMFFDWGVAFSIVPANATVSSTTFKFQVNTSSNAVNCDVVAMTSNRPSSSSASTVWNDIVGGSAYVSNNNFCTSTGTNKSLTLGSTANNDLQNRAGEWFAIGVRFIDMTRQSTARTVGFPATGGTPNPTLEIVYTVPQSYNRTAGDSITFSDSITVVLLAARSDADSWVTSESIARLYHSFRSIAETATMNDSASRKLFASRNPSDSITVSSSIGRGLAGSRSASDVVTVSDGVTYTVNRDVQQSETIPMSELIDRMLDANRTISDTVTTLDGIGMVYTEAVEIPVTLNAGSGSPTLQSEGVSVTISCEYGGIHDGDPAQQQFQCLSGETVTVSLPAATATERWIWSTGSTSPMTFAACSTGTCAEQSFTYYLQEKQYVTLTGLDSSRTASITRTQIGSTSTTAASGSATTEIWADYGTTFTIPDTVVIVANENRFKSYDLASYLSYTVTDTNAKTATYQHEFNMLFRIHEEHLGTIFFPMPPAVYTGTITTSNSTQLALTLNTQVTDDYLQPTQRYWVANGTATWANMTWRGLVANATGSQSITAYGNFDIESEVKHYGLEGQRHFRVGVDGGTIEESSAVYNVSAGTFAFEATATGTKTVKVEFMTTLFSAVNDVKVNDTSLDSANWSFADLGDNLTGVVTINNVGFSTKTIVIYFSGTGSSNPSSGGGGGGGGSGASGSSTTPPPLGLVPVGLKITVPTFVVAPSMTDTKPLRIEWSGGTSIIITKITFSKHPEWFALGAQLPLRATITQEGLVTEIPLTITIPEDTDFMIDTVDVVVEATNGQYVATTVQPMTVTLGPSADLGVYVGIGVVMMIVVAAALSVRHKVHMPHRSRRRRPSHIRRFGRRMRKPRRR